MMARRNVSIPASLLVTLLIASPLLVPAAAVADCSDVELTAVFIVSGLYPLEPQLEILDVHPLGPITNPSVEETWCGASASAVPMEWFLTSIHLTSAALGILTRPRA
jgi:hypothetical protein